MAKISRNSSTSKEPAEKANVVQFIVESLESIGGKGIEPVNHTPRLDMYSTGNEIVVESELPGVRREDMEVTFYKNSIAIKALKYECFNEPNVNYICMERSFGRLIRTIDLPFPVNPNVIKAAYSNGILRIVLPRVEEKRGTPMHIEVESS
ncbi:MAG: Hsp20/alpha crystallin family protein [Deltaproteobacteria bacterium]|nr:Hsp20/alpha crystallin family protein [Deltaproteobacteria bacterium]